jgi:hypothetical protein
MRAQRQFPDVDLAGGDASLEIAWRCNCNKVDRDDLAPRALLCGCLNAKQSLTSLQSTTAAGLHLAGTMRLVTSPTPGRPPDP